MSLRTNVMTPRTAVFKAITVAFIILATSTCHSRRVKRISFGRDLKSHAIFGTEYFVVLRHNSECMYDHDSHKFDVDFCRGSHICGGSLIHPQFLITAAHCLAYKEYAIHEVTTQPSFYDFPDFPPDEFFQLKTLKSTFIVPKFKHTVYTDYIILAGGTNDHEMTQSRHTHHIFPHPDWISMVDPNHNPINVNRSEVHHVHDFLLVQACEPFKIDKNVKLAQLDSEIQMRLDYERIVKQGLVCLYIGLGNLDEDEWVKYSRSPYTEPYSNWTQYTWRPSQCYSGCNTPFKIINPAMYKELEKYENTCHLCSTNQGPLLNEFQSGDSGSPVICDGRLTALVAAGYWKPEVNVSFATSYAIHCSRNMVTEKQLKFYLTLKPDPYHPLTRLRKHVLRLTGISSN